jgi:succinate dehydrogenase / fumarate reductase cytochrome b subunit
MSAANRPAGDRPLSPHLNIYRPQLTSVLSILHRATGIALSVGLLYLVAWVLCVASGPDAYATFADFNGSILGRLLLFGWTFSLFYHLCNGIRHLAWDAGWGFELKSAYASGWTVVAATAVLTLLSWAAGYAMR